MWLYKRIFWRCGYQHVQGFTLFEVVIGLAVTGLILTVLAPVFGRNFIETQTVESRLALSTAARSLLEALPARNDLAAGLVSGTNGTIRWTLEATPLPQNKGEQPSAWIPYKIILNLKTKDGLGTRFETVRLAKKKKQ
ncbi:MAG: prepilin-type N-terminal cleavage/methylation domain-containing protein [Hyphomicrobium sp.]